jgi:hypothetical protein
MPTIAVDKAELFKELGKEFVVDAVVGERPCRLTEISDIRPKSSTSYASSSVCASLRSTIVNH